jgi:pyruvate kinase
VLIADARTTDEMVVMVDRVAAAAGLADVGQRVVIVAGAPGGPTGATNLLRVHQVGGV